MDNSILVPEDLIIRSLPVNVELIELIREKQSKEGHSIIENISKFIHLDRLDENEAKFYMQELCKICDEEIQQPDSFIEELVTSQPSSKHIKQQMPSELEGYFLSNETGKALEEQLKALRLQSSTQSVDNNSQEKHQLPHHIL